MHLKKSTNLEAVLTRQKCVINESLTLSDIQQTYSS